MTVDVELVAQQDRRLGRQKVHDSRSRDFPLALAVDRSTWRDKAVRVYDPRPNPNQCHGECTGVAKMIQLNAAGNRVAGRVLGMGDAHRNYARNTERDPWPGTFTYDPATGATGGDDTGSSGLASAKTAAEHGIGGRYWHLFGGADEAVQHVMAGRVLSAGTWWHADMFGPSAGTYAGLPVVTPTGGRAGGHQYALRGYDAGRDMILARCWWGDFRDFWLARADLDVLLRDGGDAHWQATA